VQGAAVSGVRIALPLHDDKTRATLQQLRTRAPSSSSEGKLTGSQVGSERAPLPKIDVRDAQLHVSDVDGSLAHVTGATATLGDGVLALGAQRVVLGDDSIEASDVQLRVARGEQGFAIAGAKIVDAVLHLPEPQAAPPEPDDADVAHARKPAADAAASVLALAATAPRALLIRCGDARAAPRP
jgi:hypothetical protein